MTTTAIVLLGWYSLAAASVLLTLRWLSLNRRNPGLASIAFTTAATIPGLLLLIDFGVDFVTMELTGQSSGEFPTALLRFSTYAGPLLLAVGFVLAARIRQLPRGTRLLQASHAFLWAVSAIIGVMFSPMT